MTRKINRLCEESGATKQSPGRVEVYGVYAPRFFGGIATLALAMTRKINCLCERSEAISREGGFPKRIYYIPLNYRIINYYKNHALCKKRKSRVLRERKSI